MYAQYMRGGFQCQIKRGKSRDLAQNFILLSISAACTRSFGDVTCTHLSVNTGSKGMPSVFEAATTVCGSPYSRLPSCFGMRGAGKRRISRGRSEEHKSEI